MFETVGIILIIVYLLWNNSFCARLSFVGAVSQHVTKVALWWLIIFGPECRNQNTPHLALCPVFQVAVIIQTAFSPTCGHKTLTNLASWPFCCQSQASSKLLPHQLVATQHFPIRLPDLSCQSRLSFKLPPHQLVATKHIHNWAPDLCCQSLSSPNCPLTNLWPPNTFTSGSLICVASHSQHLSYPLTV